MYLLVRVINHFYNVYNNIKIRETLLYVCFMNNYMLFTIYTYYIYRWLSDVTICLYSNHDTRPHQFSNQICEVFRALPIFP